MYIRSSPRRPNRDPNWILSNELLLYIQIKTVLRTGLWYYKEGKQYKDYMD